MRAFARDPFSSPWPPFFSPWLRGEPSYFLLRVSASMRSYQTRSTAAPARLGEAIVRRLASEGWRVAIHYRHSDKEAVALVRELKRDGQRAIAVGCDLTHSAALPEIFAKANAALGFCSLLVNSAAIFEYDDAATVTEESMDAHYAANLRAPVLLARHFAEQLPGRRQRPDRQSARSESVQPQSGFSLLHDHEDPRSPRRRSCSRWRSRRASASAAWHPA